LDLLGICFFRFSDTWAPGDLFAAAASAWNTCRRALSELTSTLCKSFLDWILSFETTTPDGVRMQCRSSKAERKEAQTLIALLMAVCWRFGRGAGRKKPLVSE